jgi:ATP-dependent exoDNAse (exonuclease V) beta subunit
VGRGEDGRVLVGIEAGRPAWRNASRVRLDESETAHGKAEEVRLLYVALTRARERLVVLAADGKQPAPWVAALAPWGYDVENPPADGEVLAGGAVLHRRFEPEPVRVAGQEDAVEGLPEAVERYDRAVEGARARAVPPFRTPSGLEEERPFALSTEDDEVDVRGAHDERSEARAVGIAVHAALESWSKNKAEPEELASIGKRMARHAAAETGADENRVVQRVTTLLAAFEGSALGAELRDREILGNEVPLLLPGGDGEPDWRGSIDLVYRGDDGGPVVADFKTDRFGEPAALVERYGGQLRVYAEAVRSALGLQAAPRAEIWHLPSGRRIPVPLKPGGR